MKHRVRLARKLSLDQLTVIGISPLEMIRIAAEVGYDGISPIGLSAPEFDLPIQPFADDDRLCDEMAALLRATGIGVVNVDGFPLFPHTNPERFEQPLQNCARLGARFATTLILDKDRKRAADNFSRLCELADAVGLTVLLEFTPITEIGDLQQAMEFLRQMNRSNAALQLDAYHLAHSGGLPSDLSKVDPKWVVSAQISDGPLGQSAEQYAYNVLYERGIPGTGQIPLVDFIGVLPPEVPIGLEVPMKSLSDKGVSPLDRARLAFTATRKTLESVAIPPLQAR
jgi:sugar phosphate isomerase/epimerase